MTRLSAANCLLIFGLLVVAALDREPAGAQVLPEYGAIRKGIGKPGPMKFPEISTPKSAKQPIGDIAFVHKGDIYTVTLDGKHIRRLTKDGRNAFPVWSPTGRHIAFTKAKVIGGKFPSAFLQIITPDGKFSRALTQPRRYEAVYPVAWLPDGKGLLAGIHYLESDVGSELKVVTLDGKPYAPYQTWIKVGREAGFLKERTVDEPWEFTPGQAAAFSPDGKKMLFTASTEYFVDSARFDLYCMAFDGSNLRRVETLPRFWINCLRWHPKGRKLLSAEEHYPQDPEVGKYEAGIWLRDAGGKVLKKLVATTTASFSGMDWSPKGDYIIFQMTDSKYPRSDGPGSSANLSRHSSIWVMKADGSGKYKLADNACHPNWR